MEKDDFEEPNWRQFKSELGRWLPLAKFLFAIRPVRDAVFSERAAKLFFTYIERLSLLAVLFAMSQRDKANLGLKLLALVGAVMLAGPAMSAVSKRTADYVASRETAADMLVAIVCLGAILFGGAAASALILKHLTTLIVAISS